MLNGTRATIRLPLIASLRIGARFIASSQLDLEWYLSTLFDASLLTFEPRKSRLFFFGESVDFPGNGTAAAVKNAQSGSHSLTMRCQAGLGRIVAVRYSTWVSG